MGPGGWGMTFAAFMGGINSGFEIGWIGFAGIWHGISAVGNWLWEYPGEFVFNGMNNLLGGGAVIVNSYASLWLQIPDAVLPGDWFSMPAYRYYEGMIISGGGAYEMLPGNDAFTLGNFVLGPRQLLGQPDWIHHEALGHGNQEQYGPLCLPIWAATYAFNTAANLFGGKSWNEAQLDARRNNWFERQAEMYMNTALNNGTPRFVP